MINSFPSIGQSLRNHWLSHNVEFNVGVSTAALESFEKDNDVILPGDLRDYFLSVNGMLAEATDDVLFRFWMLEEIRSLPEGAPDYADPRYIENPESLFLFADFSLWAHAYAVRLTDTQPKTNEIFLIGSDSPILLFQSFSEFVDSYLTNKDLMFPHASMR